MNEYPLLFPMEIVSCSSDYGERTLNGVKEFHYGVDLTGKDSLGGDLIYMPKSGYIVKVGIDTDGARYIFAEHYGVKGIDNTKYKVVTIYWHLYSISSYCVAGAKISTGAIIGKEGKSGKTTGAHLHWGVFVVPRELNVKQYSSTALRRYAVNPFTLAHLGKGQHIAGIYGEKTKKLVKNYE